MTAEIAAWALPVAYLIGHAVGIAHAKSMEAASARRRAERAEDDAMARLRSATMRAHQPARKA